MTIAYLESQIAKAQIALNNKRAAISDGNPFALASLDSFKAHIKELQSQLRAEKINREKEVLEFRIIGDCAQFGSLPLHLHGELSINLSTTLYSLSKTLRSGSKKYAIEQNQAEIDLRLANIASGSTKLILTLNINPDMFGWSLSQNTLIYWFSLLSSIREQNEDDIVEYSFLLGSGGIKSMKRLLLMSQKNHIEFDLKWNSHLDKFYSWTSSQSDIEKAILILSSITEEGQENIELHGKISMLDRTGKIAILDLQTGNTVKLNFSNSLLHEVEQLHINQIVRIQALKTIIKNQSANSLKNIFEVMEIESLKQN